MVIKYGYIMQVHLTICIYSYYQPFEWVTNGLFSKLIKYKIIIIAIEKQKN